MGFMVTLELFQHAERRRYFVAECEGQVCGFAVCIPVYGRKGWLVEDMIIAPNAPSGCSEALIDAAMRHLAHEQADYIGLGMVALAGLDNNTGPVDHYWLSALLRVCSRTMGWLYNFEGLYRFRNKMQPTFWEPIYIVAGSKISFLTIRAILMAFAQGWVPRFGMRVVGHWIRHRLPTGQRLTQLIKPSPKPVLDWRIAGLAVICVLAVAFAVVGMGWGGISVVGGSVGYARCLCGFHADPRSCAWQCIALSTNQSWRGPSMFAVVDGAFRPYVYLHTEHHLHTNDAVADPDVWCGQGPKWILPLRWATQDIGYLRFYFQHWTERPWLEARRLAGLHQLVWQRVSRDGADIAHMVYGGMLGLVLAGSISVVDLGSDVFVVAARTASRDRCVSRHHGAQRPLVDLGVARSELSFGASSRSTHTVLSPVASLAAQTCGNDRARARSIDRPVSSSPAVNGNRLASKRSK